MERSKTYKKIVKYQFAYPNLIHPLAFLDPTSKIGMGTILANFLIRSLQKLETLILLIHSNIEHEVSIGDFNQFHLVRLFVEDLI